MILDIDPRAVVDGNPRVDAEGCVECGRDTTLVFLPCSPKSPLGVLRSLRVLRGPDLDKCTSLGASEIWVKDKTKKTVIDRTARLTINHGVKKIK